MSKNYGSQIVDLHEAQQGEDVEEQSQEQTFGEAARAHGSDARGTKRGRELFDRRLPCPLTEEELAQRRDAIVDNLDETGRLEEAKKASAASYKTEIEHKRSQLKELTTEVRDRRQYREVPRFKEEDFDAKEVRVVRRDTMDVVERRPMKAVELQTRLENLEDGDEE